MQKINEKEKVMKEEKWYVIYVCVGNGGELESAVARQVEICTSAIISRDGEEAKEKIKIYIDMGFSTINPDRPQYNALMKDIASGKVKSITVTGIDRISRNLKLALPFKELANKYDVKIFAPYVDIEKDFLQNPEFHKVVIENERLYGDIRREYETECEDIYEKFLNNFLEEHEKEINKLYDEAKTKFEVKCRKIDHAEKIKMGKELAKQNRESEKDNSGYTYATKEGNIICEVNHKELDNKKLEEIDITD